MTVAAGGDTVNFENAERVGIVDATAMQSLGRDYMQVVLESLMGGSSGWSGRPVPTAVVTSTTVTLSASFRLAAFGESPSGGYYGYVGVYDPESEAQGAAAVINIAPYAGNAAYLWFRRIEVETDDGTRTKRISGADAQVTMATRLRTAFTFAATGSPSKPPDLTAGWFIFAIVPEVSGLSPEIVFRHVCDVNNYGADESDGFRLAPTISSTGLTGGLAGAVAAILGTLAMIQDSDWEVSAGAAASVGSVAWNGHPTRGLKQLNEQVGLAGIKLSRLSDSAEIRASMAAAVVLQTSGAATGSIVGNQYANTSLVTSMAVVDPDALDPGGALEASGVTITGTTGYAMIRFKHTTKVPPIDWLDIIGIDGTIAKGAKIDTHNFLPGVVDDPGESWWGVQMWSADGTPTNGQCRVVAWALEEE